MVNDDTSVTESEGPPMSIFGSWSCENALAEALTPHDPGDVAEQRSVCRVGRLSGLELP